MLGGQASLTHLRSTLVPDTPPTSNDHWRVPSAQMAQLRTQKPWRSSRNYFESVEISSLAALKILLHAQTGYGKQGMLGGSNNWIEVMGYLKGYFTQSKLVITDSFSLPVEANEVECQLSEDAQIYLVGHMEYERSIGRDEPAIGWYHSHPGYSCYLSGTDVGTQKMLQQSQDPWVALVVDPVRTLATGKMELKAFRTLPEHTQAPPVDVYGFGRTGATKPTDLSSIPIDKLEAFGAYVDQYYELPIKYFRNEGDAGVLDALWERYWGQTLASSSLLANRPFAESQVANVVTKLDAVHTLQTPKKTIDEKNVARDNATALITRLGGLEVTQSALEKNIKNLTQETTQDLLSHAVRGSLFGY